MRTSLLVVFAGLWGVACASAGPPLPDVTGLPPVDKDGIGRVVFEEVRVRFGLQDGEPVAFEQRRRVVRIEGRRSKHLADLAVRYDRTFTTVTAVQVRSRAPSGAAKVWTRQDAQDVPLFGGSVLYTDQRGLFLDVADQAAGTLVEQTSETRRRAAQHFVHAESFEEDVPVDEKRVVLQVPAGWELDWIVEKRGARTDAAPTITDDVDGRTFVWERKGLAALAPTAWGPSHDEVAEIVAARLKSWIDSDGAVARAPADDREHARFQHGLMAAQARSDADVKAMVQKVLAGTVDEPRAKARRLYAWVRDSVRYCAVEVGYGGWVPHAAPSVLSARAGDCKDKANLLKTMLDVAGVPSDLVIIFSGDWPRRYRFPVLAANFNHAILAIHLPEGRVFVDPTSRTAAFGDLPNNDEDRLALLADAAGTGLVPMTSSSPDIDVRDETYELTLKTDGTAEGSFRVSLGGWFADDVRHRLLLEPRKRWDEVIGDAIAILQPEVKETGLRVENAAPPEEPTAVSITGELVVDVVPGFVAGNDVVLRTGQFVVGGVRELDDGPRDVPALLGARFRTGSVLRLRLPPSLRVRELPGDTRAECPWGRYERRVRTEEDGAVLVIERSVTRRERLLPADAVADYRAFARTTMLADEAPIVLTERRR